MIKRPFITVRGAISVLGPGPLSLTVPLTIASITEVVRRRGSASAVLVWPPACLVHAERHARLLGTESKIERALARPCTE